MGVPIDNEELRKQKKKEKKLKKLKQQQEAAGSDNTEDLTVVDGVPASDEGKKKKKDKKKSKEAAAEQPEASTDKSEKKKKKKKDKSSGEEEQAGSKRKAEDAADDGSKKKKKKQDAAASPSAPAAGAALEQPIASVGDKELAAKGQPIRKVLYTEHSEVAAMSAQQVQQLREERQMTVEGCDIKPLVSFQQTGLPANMLHATRTFQQPSPIQSQCWPIVLSGRDLIGIAATGSGKTLAFGLPMLRHVSAQRDAGVVQGKGPFTLTMAPTRELAIQIAEVLEEAGSKCGCRCLCVYGGVPKPPQQQALRQGIELLVGTPGRLEDLMNEGSCRLNQVTYLVLDEADRMLDLGFEPHIRAICNQVRADRQTLMFSATWPMAVQQLAINFLSRPVKVTIGSHDLSASHSVKQVVEVIDPAKRDFRLLDLMQKYHSSRKNRVIIFVLYKKEAPRVESLLQRKGWSAAAIHGDISQVQRSKAVEQFKSGQVPLLIATDVAARGLDIPDVEVVINYSFPLTTEDYVHRIGRTGRAGKTGVAHTFFQAGADKPRAGELINVLREAKQEVPQELLAFGTTVKKKESKLYGAHFKDVDLNAKASKITFDD